MIDKNERLFPKLRTFHPRRNFTILHRSVAITVRIATREGEGGGRARCICNYRAGKLLWNYTISQQFFPSPFKKSSTDSMPVISLRREHSSSSSSSIPSLTSQSIGLVKITGILLHVIITLIIVLNIFFSAGGSSSFHLPAFFLSLRNPDTSFPRFFSPPRNYSTSALIDFRPKFRFPFQQEETIHSRYSHPISFFKNFFDFYPQRLVHLRDHGRASSR